MSVAQGEKLIQEYYAAFNARRLSDAAALFTADAVILQIGRQPFPRGAAGYLQLAELWLAAFPDAHLTVDRVISRDEVTHEVYVVASGTHSGPLDLGSVVFQSTGIAATMNARELLQVRGDRIAYSSLSFDLQQLVDQLVIIDYPKVLLHLESIRTEGDRLAAAQNDATRSREIALRLGLEIDAARHAVRPYYKR